MRLSAEPNVRTSGEYQALPTIATPRFLKMIQSRLYSQRQREHILIVAFRGGRRRPETRAEDRAEAELHVGTGQYRRGNTTSRSSLRKSVEHVVPAPPIEVGPLYAQLKSFFAEGKFERAGLFLCVQCRGYRCEQQYCDSCCVSFPIPPSCFSPPGHTFE